MAHTSRFEDITDRQLGERAHAMLRRFFGYSSFRPGQLDIIITLLRGRDTVVLMPTGGGKSITFQIPALMLPGLTIVVSPLLSLMRDQVEALTANGIPAATLNSLQSDDENRAVADALTAGHIKLLYISPERLLADLPRWNSSLDISLVAIDEAHCISHWGHDFRPDYTRLSELRSALPTVPIVALTATADRLTRDDIARQLRLDDHATFITSFDRPNLSLNVMPAPKGARRFEIISTMIDRHPHDVGIVYCLSRKTTETVAAELVRRGYRAAPYHAALPPQQRLDTQNAFREGRLQVVAATVAFGMGIDKSNIRWVIHYNMPSCIESYYQEIGRAGRDGMPSQTIMFYSVQDLISLRHFAEESGQAGVNLEKLKRMEQYAEAKICRRRMLLSYFGETLDHDCGNCDVCLSPPQRYDASTPVRMALSAMVRVGEQVGASMLTDILRGSARADLRAHGFDRIKTYGVGRDIPASDWHHIILQMIQLGIVDIAYDDGNKLRVTDYGRRILYSTEPVMLARNDGYDNYRAGRKTTSQPRVKPDVSTLMLAALVDVREKLSAKEGTASYLVLSDPTIRAIVEKKPLTMAAFAMIEGISERKAALYWGPVAKALSKVSPAFKPVVEHSRYTSLFLFRRGTSPAEIARIRGIQIQTVYSHLADLAVACELTHSEIDSVVDPTTLARIVAQYKSLGPGEKMYELYASQYPDGLLTFAFAVARMRGLIG